MWGQKNPIPIFSWHVVWATYLKTRVCNKWQRMASSRSNTWWPALGQFVMKKEIVQEELINYYLIIIQAWKLVVIPKASLCLSPTFSLFPGIWILLLNVSQYCWFSPHHFLGLGHSSSRLSLPQSFRTQLKGYPFREVFFNLPVQTSLPLWSLTIFFDFPPELLTWILIINLLAVMGLACHSFSTFTLVRKYDTSGYPCILGT